MDKIYRYNQRHASLAMSDYTAYAYAMMTPVDELLEIMRQVDRDAPSLEPNRFHPNKTPIERNWVVTGHWWLRATRSNAIATWMT